MNQKRPEPSPLKRGKAFHKEIQSEWKQELQAKEDTATTEKTIEKPDGSHGRIDIHVDAGDGLSAVVEIKSTDWTRMSESQTRRRVEEYSEQIWEYIEHELTQGSDVSPGIVLTGLPAEPDRTALIEQLFGEHGIAVVWQDETVEEARARHNRAQPD